MSRKSDIAEARKVQAATRCCTNHATDAALEAAYDLGRAAQSVRDRRSWSRTLAKRLRDKVRKAAGETR